MNENLRRSKVLLSIPLFVLILFVICSQISSYIKLPTNRGEIYTFLVSIEIILIFTSPIPCVVIAILGIYFAIRAKAESNVKNIGLIALGLLEIMIYMLLFYPTVILVDYLFEYSFGIKLISGIMLL